MRISVTRIHLGFAAILGWCAAHSVSAADAVWTAGSGLLPTNATPPWSYYEEPTATVTLATGILRLNTSPAFARASYFQEDDLLSIPSNWKIEAEVRFVSGTSNVVGRAPAGIVFFPTKGIANWLWIGKDEIFVNSGTRFQRGVVANVDTDDAFHKYRIELHGGINGSSFDVFYDDALTLTGTLFADDEDQEPEIAWGDIAYEASGVSEWKSFTHNGAVPEPTSAALLLVGAVMFLNKRRSPSPARAC